jgi:hypothetical protein
LDNRKREELWGYLHRSGVQTLLATPENHLGALQEKVVISSSTIVNLD